MGILVFILGGLSAAWGFLTKLPWQLYACVGLVLLGGWIFHGGSCREFLCSRDRTPRPPRIITYTGTVVSIEAANRFTLATGRRQRNPVTIQHIVTSRGPEALAGLLAVGDQVAVQSTRSRLLGSEAEGDATDATDDAQGDVDAGNLEARGPITGEVYGPTGMNVGIELIKAGAARATDNAPDTYRRK